MIIMSEIFICDICGYEHENYEDLRHYSLDSGGFCVNCDSDSLQVVETDEE